VPQTILLAATVELSLGTEARKIVAMRAWETVPAAVKVKSRLLGGRSET
jgi:hypothetical protein